MQRNKPPSEHRPTTRNLGVLVRLFAFIKPYRSTVTLALVALLVAATAVLAFGQVIREVVDEGLSSGTSATLTEALTMFLVVVVVMAASVAGRAYLVNWLGERVVADIREAVFGHVLRLEPAFFETTRTGEVITRLTTDTSLIQVVVGSTAAIAMRNLLLVMGGFIMLGITSPKLKTMTPYDFITC